MNGIVSIIVPVYNAEQYLDTCIQSILRQSYKNLQIILVNDGSSDRSMQICKKYEKRDARILVIDQKNGGAGAARNAGLVKAEGDHTVFIDSDDWIEENYILDMLQAAGRYENSMIICGYSICYISENRKMKRKGYIPSFHDLDGRKLISGSFKELMDSRFILMPVAKLYRTRIIKKYQLKFDQNRAIGEDMLFNLEYLAHIKHIRSVSTTNYNYRIRKDTSLTHSFGRERIKNTEELFTAGKNFCLKNGMEECICNFSKYYFKSHMNFLESKISAGESSLWIRSYIKEIFDQDSLDTALKFKNRTDLELDFYDLIFSLKNPNLIRLAGYIRIFAKNHMRGF